MDKYLSIITNFGCHYKCPYCIVKNNNINVPLTTIEGLMNLENAIKDNGCNVISLSGGGDPLHNFSEHIDWYFALMTIIANLPVELEMHTSYLESFFPMHICKRVVYHLHSYEQLNEIRRYGNEIVRVVFVVTENFNQELIDNIASFCRNSEDIDELSFRQMVDSNYQETDYCKEYLKSGHKKLWWYIEQCDYNLYYAENKVYTEYRKIGEQNAST